MSLKLQWNIFHHCDVLMASYYEQNFNEKLIRKVVFNFWRGEVCFCCHFETVYPNLFLFYFIFLDLGSLSEGFLTIIQNQTILLIFKEIINTWKTVQMNKTWWKYRQNGGHLGFGSHIGFLLIVKSVSKIIDIICMQYFSELCFIFIIKLCLRVL